MRAVWLCEGGKDMGPIAEGGPQPKTELTRLSLRLTCSHERRDLPASRSLQPLPAASGAAEAVLRPGRCAPQAHVHARAPVARCSSAPRSTFADAAALALPQRAHTHAYSGVRSSCGSLQPRSR
jgi:hypothetical protein